MVYTEQNCVFIFLFFISSKSLFLLVTYPIKRVKQYFGHHDKITIYLNKSEQSAANGGWGNIHF